MTCKGCIAALEHSVVRIPYLNDNNKRVLRRYTFCFSFQQLLSKNARLFSLFVIYAAVYISVSGPNADPYEPDISATSPPHSMAQ